MAREYGVASQVRQALQEHYKDVRYVELETAENIANRLMGWAKLFGFFAGIPLLLMAVWLGWLGYVSINDVRGKLTELQADVSGLEKKRDELGKAAADLTAKGKALQDVIADLERDVTKKRLQLAKLNELDAMEQQLAALAMRVKTLEAVRFSGAASLPEATRLRIQNTLARYQERFAALGHRFEAKGEIGVQIQRSAGPNGRRPSALYRMDTKTMIVDETYTKFDDVVLREYTHHILTAGGVRLAGALGTLESGLADYFSRSFEGAPSYPSMPARTLANDFRISDDPRDVYKTGLAWGALGWDLRGRLDADAADALLLDAWNRTKGGGGFEPRDFGQALLAADQARNRGANAATIREVLAKRGVSV